MAITYNSTVNQLEIIKTALGYAGVISDDETPTDAQGTKASTILNMMLRAWYADGMPIWNIVENSFPLVAAQEEYVIGSGQAVNLAKPLKLIQAWIRNTTSNVDTPLQIITRQEYNMLGNKTSSGRPSQIHYDPLVTTGKLRVFPSPDSNSATNDQIWIVYQEEFNALTGASSLLDFPLEWEDAVTWGLAERLAYAYGLPVEERRDIKTQAKQAKDMALSFGSEEGSLYFQVDRRGY